MSADGGKCGQKQSVWSMCVCVCVAVAGGSPHGDRSLRKHTERERERERERQRVGEDSNPILASCVHMAHGYVIFPNPDIHDSKQQYNSLETLHSSSLVQGGWLEEIVLIDL